MSGCQFRPPAPGQSHLIFETGSTGCVTTSQLSKPCCAIALPPAPRRQFIPQVGNPGFYTPVSYVFFQIGFGLDFICE
jgi:hypothetical protein